MSSIRRCWISCAADCGHRGTAAAATPRHVKGPRGRAFCMDGLDGLDVPRQAFVAYSHGYAPMHPTMPATNVPFASFPPGGVALVVGASGGIGSALVERLAHSGHFAEVLGTRRDGSLALDLTHEASISAAIENVAARGELRLVVDATGVLHGGGFLPEKSLRDLDAAHFAHAFVINAIGPALLMKHVLPRLPREGKSVFATLSARVGSIGDNRLGGWHAYRASKAALNQLVRTAAIELKRRAPHAVCIALHPGTVDTSLSAPFAKTGLEVHSPADAATHLLSVIEGLEPAQSGGFYDWRGDEIPW